MKNAVWLAAFGLQVVIITSPFYGIAQSSDSVNSLNSKIVATNSLLPSKSSTGTVVVRADQLAPQETAEPVFAMDATIAQSRNLIDFKDGSRQDSFEILLVPRLLTTLGTFNSKIQYVQNLKDSEDINNGFADATLTYTYPAINWDWSSPYILFVSPGISLVAPISQVSRKQTDLQTATIFNLNMGVKPDELVKRDQLWNFIVGFTAGRNFHAYEEDINGTVLNKYSSNQLMTIGYNYNDWSMQIDFVNRTRWTYQNKIRQSFIMNEEVNYQISPNFSAGIGHTNEASALKADGYESNLNIVDEKTSTVFVQLGVSF